MSTIGKNNKKPDESVNQSSSSNQSSFSNYKWWLASFVLIIIISFIGQRQINNDNNNNSNIKSERLFTLDELQTFTKDELYLAILGHVFNVTSAPRFYSSTGSYKFYTGRDASRSFHTGGTSSEDLTDDLTGLTDEDIAGVYGWLTFYKKQYPQIGKLIGRYFDSNGELTEHFNNVLTSVNIIEKEKEEKARFEKQWPPCNSEWSHDAGRRVWCTEKSGGIERTWTGVPRRAYDSATKTERCVCVQNTNEQNGRFKQYKDCSPTSVECKILD
ncbi:unnamed protein product [Rotaria socialis]|uniref:Cytochrome b5 heme-binding domain-containing protein n=2 Tax=Rotaria socialis TaxID=392032 RepID=A0A820LFS5_9BILA|nr:unnamed protein product [Rotaria socialis]CAF3382612.1 unnamed protein product [Rotaria socialis]CAF3754147.1 unnamed protein product [Rotaria socialis]CAF4209930.1 unnamed protein product [Rotaria socialis]CAF4356505.1 unnamed protein product [Rotaria socialis]